MARKTWSGAITFAGFPIHVCLFPRAKSRAGQSFKQLSPNTKGPVKQQLVDDNGEIVAKTDCLKGIEVGKDQFKALPDEAVEMIQSAERTTELQPVGFPPLDTVDLTLSTGAYVLVPDPKVAGAEQPATILWNGLRASGRALVASITLRAGSRDTIVVIHADDDGLLANTLMFASEVADDLPKFSPQEDEDAAELFSQVVARQYEDGPFDHASIESNYEQRRSEAVQAALNGETIEAPEKAEAQAKAPDLMAALKASLGDEEAKPKKAKPKKKAKASA